MTRKGLVVLVVVIRLIATGTNFSDTKWSRDCATDTDVPYNSPKKTSYIQFSILLIV